MQEIKKCPKCSMELPLASFGKNRSTRDGLQIYCKPCACLYASERRASNLGKIREQERASASRNREARRQRCKDWGKRNAEYKRTKAREYYWQNRDAVLAYKQLYRQENQDKIYAWNGTRRAIERRARIRSADIGAMAALYRRARQLTKETGIAHHVDHIIPLRHESVCGLHVEWNMRVITASSNMAKSNTLHAD